MKNSILFLSLLTLFCLSHTNPKPEKIYPITAKIMPLAYYDVQANLWKLELEKDRQNHHAWYNYYSAARAANILSKEKVYDLEQITSDIIQAIPNTFESEFIQFWNGNWEKENRQHLKKAHALAPERSEAYKDLMLLHWFENDLAQATFFAKQFFESGAYSAGLVNWSYNQLMSVEEEAILFTTGDNDTFFGLLLQLHHQIKPSVTIVNQWMLLIDDFREAVFEQLDMPDFEQQIADFKDKDAYRLAIIEHIIQHTEQPIYFGTGSGLEHDPNYRDQLFQVGLAYRYAETRFDNFAHLQDNIENHFFKDYLYQEMKIDQGASVVNSMNQHYLSPFLMLYGHYQDSGAILKAEKLAVLIRKIAAKGQHVEAVEKYLEAH
ncbi:MAG: hypothetical protein AAF847_08335 [Bacteroidota bacterium]